jgi:hypothetical protein
MNWTCAEKRSGLECKAKRRWSGISGEDHDAELWLIGILLFVLRYNPTAWQGK